MEQMAGNALLFRLKKTNREKTPITKVEIDYSKNWQKIHLKSIESAYRLSAFYEYFADEFKSIYEQKIRFLFEWNMKLLTTTFHLLGIDTIPQVTESYINKTDQFVDFRTSIHPKSRLNKPDGNFQPIPYQQVFKDRYNFIPISALSICYLTKGRKQFQLYVSHY